MSLYNIGDLINQSIENIKKMIDIDTVMGTPIITDDTTVIPVSKMTIGVVAGGANKMDRTKDAQEFPIGASGGGVNVVPMGFLVIKDGETNFIKTQGDSTDKWLDIVQSSLRSITK